MDIITRLNWVDILVIIIMLRTSYVAFQDGLSHEILPVIGVSTSLVLSLYYYKIIAIVISQNMGNLPVGLLNVAAFAAVFAAIIFVFKFVRLIFDKIIKVTWHPLIERFGGLIAGIVKASLVTSAVLIILVLMPLSYLRWSVCERSFSGMYFLRIGPAIYAKVAKVLPVIKYDGASPDEGSVVSGLLADADKAVETKTGKEAAKSQEWEKPFLRK